MSSGGHLMAMITSLKNNARPKRKVFKDLYNRYQEYRDAEHLAFKKADVTPQQLQQINAKIRRKIKYDYRQKVLNTIMVFSVVSLLLFLFIRGISQWTAHKITEHQQQKKETGLSDQAKINQLIYLGSREMGNNQYSRAKRTFQKAVIIDDRHYLANSYLLDAYVLDCLENGKDCDKAGFLLNRYKNKFGESGKTNDWEMALKNKR